MPKNNAFESGERKVIPAVLVYLRKDNQILMIHKKSDFHEGKWNGLGGKLERDESPWEAAQRELLEESGVDLPQSQFNLLGVLQFPNFKPHKCEDWMVYVFTAKLPGEDLQKVNFSCPEGDLHWVPVDEVLSRNLWAGDLHFIPYVLEERPFAGTIWYSQQDVTKWILQPLQCKAVMGHICEV